MTSLFDIFSHDLIDRGLVINKLASLGIRILLVNRSRGLLTAQLMSILQVGISGLPLTGVCGYLMIRTSVIVVITHELLSYILCI